MNKKTKSFLLSVLTLSFIFSSCSSFFNDLQKRKNQNLFNITIQETSNGTVTAAKSSGIKAGEEVILSVTATSGYELKTISVTNTQNKDVAVAAMEQGTSYKFTMPASDVTVGAAFDKAGPVDITMPGDLNNSSGDTVYKIEHCQQSLTDTGLYDLVAIQYKRGNAGDQTTAVSSDFPGFTALAFDQQTINSDGNTIVRIYYDRNIITYTFDPNGGNWGGNTEPIVLSGLYEAVVNKPEDPDGYGYTFTGWDKSNLQLFGPESQTITACWDADNTTSYTIREYLQSVEGGNNYTLDKEYQRTGSVLTFTPETQYGFDYNIVPLYLDSNENGVINVYYNRKYYTVTFITNGGNSIADQQILYQASPTIIPVKEGYTFINWYYDSYCTSICNANNGITTDTTLYAFWMYDSVIYRLHDTVVMCTGDDKNGSYGPEGEYVFFGDYPQSLLAGNVIVDETKTIQMGSMIVYPGDDGNIYYKSGSEESGFNYFMIEPIKWCVISKDENNKALLLAENILDAMSFDSYHLYWSKDQVSEVGTLINNLFELYWTSEIMEQLNTGFINNAFSDSSPLLLFSNLPCKTASIRFVRTIRYGSLGEDFFYYGNDNTNIFHPINYQSFDIKVSLLESYELLSINSSKIRTRTDYAIANGAEDWWWINDAMIKTQGKTVPPDVYATIINNDGTIGQCEAEIYYRYASTNITWNFDAEFTANGGVVPVIYVYLPE